MGSSRFSLIYDGAYFHGLAPSKKLRRSFCEPRRDERLITTSLGVAEFGIFEKWGVTLWEF